MNEMEERLITQLDECLAAIEAGESIERCLARYSDAADELAPLLQISLALKDLPQPGPSAATARAAKTQFLAAGEQRRKSATRPSVWQRFSRFWVRFRRGLNLPTWPAPVRALATTAIALALALLIGGGVVQATSGSLPGDPLYGFKLLGEDVRRALTLDHDRRIRLEETFTERRRAEVQKLLSRGRQEQVEFGGLLRQRDDGRWRIEDIPVVVDAGTRLQAEPALNTFVEVHGVTQADGTVLAQLVEIEGDEIVGRIERMEQDYWRVAGHRIQVDEETYVQPSLGVGDCVEVHARRFSDGTLLGLEIERTDECPEDGDEEKVPEDGTPSPTPTPTATATSSPTPTATLSPSSTPNPTPTVRPTATSTISSPSPTPSPLPPAPTGEDDDDDEGTPTIQPPPPTATGTPLPSATATPTDDDDDDDDDDDETPTMQPQGPTSTPSPPTPTPTEEKENDDDDDNDNGNSNDNDNGNDNDNDNDNNDNGGG